MRRYRPIKKFWRNPTIGFLSFYRWSDKGDKIKGTNDYSEAGLKMIHLISFNKALKSTWVKKYVDPEYHGKCKYLFEWQLHQYEGPAIFRGNLNKEDMHKYVTTTHFFTTEILHLWSEISHERNVNSLVHLFSLPLWHNSLIRIDNKPVFYQSWYSKGIINVADLFKDQNSCKIN